MYRRSQRVKAPSENISLKKRKTKRTIESALIKVSYESDAACCMAMGRMPESAEQQLKRGTRFTEI